ncbi:hypothetical protein Cadr_000008097 [Camelus dromedarius]|uniref:Uncharacterized protein n=1 Tax=Camelus dromedarius TaxID=9838 RepID=A0A5N4DZC7_CAMDR|nr:hypothetical protein Cadr_000008097 [Camelus dromedarius]KAB1276334.1 hypothetical protein Cadr_000008097 [Camelus dromedarius]
MRVTAVFRVLVYSQPCSWWKMLLFPCRPRRRQEADRGGYDMPRVSHSKTLVFLLVHLTSHVAGMAELAGQQAEERCYVKRKPERTNGTGWSGEEEETD